MIKKFSKLKWWQIALLSIVVSAIGGLSSGLPNKKEIELYTDELDQAPWAPPGWLFAPAWTSINYFLLIALQRILNSKVAEKRKMLILQGLIWFIFFSFNYVYFNKKSSILAAIWTMAGSVFAITSFSVALKSDKKTALHYLPLVVWTLFAGTVADYQALKNPDPVFGTKALLD
ncbi:MAG: TspO/MBR family protein [Ginsengibacter sp.]